MAAALVQKNSTYASTVAYSGAVTLGNILVVTASGTSTTDSITISDNQSNTWTKVVSHQVSSGTGGFTVAVNAGIWVATANGNNTPTITISGSGLTDPGGGVYEFSGITATVDGTPTSEHVAATAAPTPASPLVTSVTDVIICSVHQEQAGGTFSASGGGFTFGNGNGGHVDGSSYVLNGAAGNYSCVTNYNTAASPWVILQMALKLPSTPNNSGFFRAALY